MKNIKVSTHAVLFSDNRILILRRSKTDARRYLEWDLPGGIVDKREEFNNACAREIKEEAGIKIEPANLYLAFASTKNFESLSVTWLIYVATSTDQEVALSYEHDKYKWVSLDEAIELVAYEPQLLALKHIHKNNLQPQLFDKSV